MRLGLAGFHSELILLWRVMGSGIYSQSLACMKWPRGVSGGGGGGQVTASDAPGRQETLIAHGTEVAKQHHEVPRLFRHHLRTGQ